MKFRAERKVESMSKLQKNFYGHGRDLKTNFCKKLNSRSGQGTTEYAILVGVLVVIAIIAIIAFKPNLQALWDAIQNGMSSLS